MGCCSVYDHAQHEGSLLMQQATTAILTCKGHAVQCRFLDPLHGHTDAVQCLLFFNAFVAGQNACTQADC